MVKWGGLNATKTGISITGWYTVREARKKFVQVAIISGQESLLVLAPVKPCTSLSHSGHLF